MNENFSDNDQLMSPVLDATQQQVLRALRAKQTDKFPLGDWYLGALYALQNKYNPDRIAQAAHSLRELLEKLPIVVCKSDIELPNFKEMRKNIYKRWIEDKERYDGKWRDKKIDNQLDKTLQEIDEYLERNQSPTRIEQIQSAMRENDPMADISNPKIQKARDDQLRKLWNKLQSFVHHGRNLEEQSFMECFSAVDQIIFEQLAPITAQNQQEIRTILEKPTPTEDDINSMLELIKRSKWANYAFFFSHVKDSAWLEPLRYNGYFDNPPDSAEMPDGGYSAPFWPPISYLVRVCETKPEQVLEILENLPKTSNPHILEGIMDVVLKADSVEVVNRLSSKILSFLDHAEWGHNKIIELLKKPFLFDKKLARFTSEFLRKLVGFVPDPDAKEKQARRLEILDEATSHEPMSGYVEYVTTFLEPSPRFKEWEYAQILKNGIRPLCEKDPYQIARILTSVTVRMIYLRKYQEDLDKKGDEDSSEIWCRRLNRSDRRHPDTKEMLVHTLTFACEKVYEKSPESIEGLDQTLRNQRWKIFKRLRQHLYALNPNEQTLSWIREFILQYKDYDKWKYGYEFQQMIHLACNYFGTRLLNEKERTTIFEAILSGPSREEPLERMGDQFTEEGFQQHQRYFHRMQLRPFKHLLTGGYQSYFQELEDASDEGSPNNEDYSPVSQWGKVSYRSPSSPEELAGLSDEELLKHINTWQEGRPWYEENRYEDDQWVAFNIRALANAFQTVFKDTIIPNEERLTFWLGNHKRIERPVYVRAIILAIQEHVKEEHYERLDLWFELCEWVLSHPDSDEIDESQEQIDREFFQPDESREHPDWGSSRRAVGDFIGECLKEEMDVPFTARESLANILRLLCKQFDRRLDKDEPVFLNSDDQITEAINNTRSRALEDLVKFGFWVRRHDNTDSVPEVTSILEERFKKGAEYPLTRPERAVIGMCYGSICSLNQSWAAKYKTIFFPQDDLSVWIETFGSFLHFNRPFKPAFEILRDNFVFALDHLPEFEDDEIADKLGQHLFVYYLWEVYPLNGEDSLLERIYEKTKNDPQRWANLSNHIGWSVRNSSEHLEQGLIDRIVAFFDWRIEQKESEELRKIIFWLKAECLDSDWRLDAYARILDVSPSDDMDIFFELDILNEMLESHTAKVVERFTKITDAINQNGHRYIQADKAKPILKAGRNSKDERVRENAERARENLLSAGFDGFLDI